MPPPPLVYDPDRQTSVFAAEPAREHEPQPPFCLPAEKPWWPLLAEELKSLKWHHKGKLIALEPKEELMKRLRRSPNCVPRRTSSSRVPRMTLAHARGTPKSGGPS